MLPKKNRLSGFQIFKVKAQGKLVQSSLFGLLILKTTPTAPSRFAFIVSPKVAKLAVNRNRLRRLLSQAVSNHQFPKGSDYIFLAKKTLNGKPLQEISNEIKRTVGATRGSTVSKQ